MAKIIKKAFPKVKGTEITIQFKNRHGNSIAAVINDNGYIVDPELNSDINNDDLKIKIAKNVQNGLIVIRDVEVKETKANLDEKFLKDFESLIKKPSQQKEESKPQQHKTTTSTSTNNTTTTVTTSSQKEKEQTKLTKSETPKAPTRKNK
jgi:uncharacterized protein (DUF2344 family)